MQIKRLRKKISSLSQTPDKVKLLIQGTLIAVFLIIVPYLHYLYQGVPTTETWDTPFGVLKSNYYGNVQIFAWVFVGKIIPLACFIIWFSTCKHWWYHAILVPICMYAFQTYSTLTDTFIIDTKEIYFLAPIVFVMAIFSYTIRTRVFDKIYGIDLSELSRVSWKGEIIEKPAEPDVDIIDTHEFEEEEEDAPLFMG